MKDIFRDFLEDDGDLADLIEVSEGGVLDLTSANFKNDPTHDTPIAIHMQTQEAVGAVAGAGVTVVEKGNGVIHQTVFTLTAAVIPTTTALDNQPAVGGLKIYDFPAGSILRLGTIADISSTVAAADQSKLADNASEGDIGLGTVIPADTDAFGTDATDDDWGTAEPYVNTAHVDSDIEVNSEGVGIHVAGGTALDLNLNGSVDTLDITNTGGAVAVGLEITGTITITWINLGSFA